MTREPSFRSKILVPRRSGHLIRRDRLLARIAGDDAPSVTVVGAPAGYGKTTLLIDVAHDTPGEVSWVSLDEWDQDPVTFLMYLRLAVDGWSTDGEAGHIQPTPESLHQALAGIAGEIERQQTPRLLILDDFHWVDDSEAVTRLVNYLLQRQPDNLRIVIASRREPRLQTLPKLRLQQRVLDFGAADLIFTEDEIHSYYSASGMTVSKAVAERVAQLTHGWPAGVALLGNPTGNIENLEAVSARMSDYLSAEVLSGLRAQVRDFLVETSVLETLSAEVCDWVLQSSSTDLLEEVSESSIPLVRVGADASEIRIHPLVRDALREELRSRDQERFRMLHRRAAERAESIGHLADAIAHRIPANDWAEVARLISREAPRYYAQGRWHTIAAWIRAVPQAQLDEHPDLRLWEARIFARLGQFDHALRILSEYSPLITDPVRIAQFETVRAAALRAKGDVAEAIASAGRAVETALKHDSPISDLIEARKEYALALMAGGSFEEAIGEFRAILEFQSKTGKTEEIAFTNGCLGSALGAVGRLTESAEHLERARQQWQSCGNTKELTYTLTNLGVTYHRMGQPALASDIFQQTIAKSRQSGNRRAEAWALASLGDLELESGNAASARKRFDQAYEIAAELGDMAALTHSRCGLALCTGALGHPEKGITLARQALLSAEERGSSYEQGVAYLALGRLSRQRGRLEDAVSHLSEAAGMFERTGATRELGQALLLLGAAALPRRTSRAMARVCLERFAKLAPQLGEDSYSLLPLDEINRLVEYGASRRVAGNFFRQMLQEMRNVRGETVDQETTADASTRLPAVKLVALGDFRVEVDGRNVLSIEWESEKSREMFLLLTTSDRPLSRDEIVAALWPDTGGQKASSSFHSTLHRLRRAIYKEFVIESGGRYSIHPDAPLDCDVRRFEEAIANSDRTGGDTDATILQEAIEAYRGRFAPGFDGEWIDVKRSALEERFLRAAVRLTERLLSAADYAGAAAVCERAIEIEPYNESIALHLMKAQQAAGDIEGALRTYRRIAETLEVDLGEAPGEPLQKLNSQLRSLVGRSSNLPL